MHDGWDHLRAASVGSIKTMGEAASPLARLGWNNFLDMGAPPPTVPAKSPAKVSATGPSQLHAPVAKSPAKVQGHRAESPAKVHRSSSSGSSKRGKRGVRHHV